MVFKTNYRFGRAERDRIKKAKKEEKLKKRQERGAESPAPAGSEYPHEHTPTDDLG